MSAPGLEPGRRVRAKKDILGLLRVTVPRGTTGVVMRVGEFGAVLVRFDNGRTLEVSEVLIELI